MSSQDDVHRRGAAIVSQIISSIREEEESNSTEALSALELPQPTEHQDSLSSSNIATTKSRPHSRISSVSASTDTRSDVFDEASITSSITSRASTPLGEQDNMTLPLARGILLHALERLAPHITLERLKKVLRLISVDITEREFYMLSTVVRCSCPPTGQLTTKCTICDMNICKVSLSIRPSEASISYCCHLYSCCQCFRALLFFCLELTFIFFRAVVTTSYKHVSRTVRYQRIDPPPIENIPLPQRESGVFVIERLA